MPNTTIFLHRSVRDYLDHLAENVMELSRSETVETILRYVFDNDLEGEVWEHYDDLLKTFEDNIEEYEEGMAPVWEKEEEEGSSED